MDLFRDGNWFDGDQSDASDAEDLAGQWIYTKAADHTNGARLRGRQKQLQERQQQQQRQAHIEATQRREQQQQAASSFTVQEQKQQEQQQSQQEQQQHQPQQQHQQQQPQQQQQQRELPGNGGSPQPAAVQHQHHEQQEQLGSASIDPATTMNHLIYLNLCRVVLLRGKLEGSVCLSKSTVPGAGKCDGTRRTLGGNTDSTLAAGA